MGVLIHPHPLSTCSALCDALYELFSLHGIYTIESYFFFHRRLMVLVRWELLVSCLVSVAVTLAPPLGRTETPVPKQSSL